MLLIITCTNLRLNPIVTRSEDRVVGSGREFGTDGLVRVIIMMTPTRLHNKMTSLDVATPYRIHHLYIMPPFLYIYFNFHNHLEVFFISKKRSFIHFAAKNLLRRCETVFSISPLEGTAYSCIIRQRHDGSVSISRSW